MAIIVADTKLETEKSAVYTLYFDLGSELADLPNSTSTGKSTRITKTAMPCSVAYCIELARKYMLGSDDQWHILSAVPGDVELEMQNAIKKMNELVATAGTSSGEAKAAAEKSKEIAAQLGSWLEAYQFVAVTELPETAAEKTAYLLPVQDGVIKCYIYADGGWIPVGGKDPDLSNYITNQALTQALREYVTRTVLEEALGPAVVGIVEQDGGTWLKSANGDLVVKLPDTDLSGYYDKNEIENMLKQYASSEKVNQLSETVSGHSKTLDAINKNAFTGIIQDSTGDYYLTNADGVSLVKLPMPKIQDIDLSDYYTAEQVNRELEDLSAKCFQGIVKDDDGKYWLVNGKEEQLVELPATGGGGNQASLVTLTNETKVNGEKVLSFSVALGKSAVITYGFSDTDPDFGGTAKYYVNGNAMAMENITQGTRSWDAGRFLVAGENKIKIVISDENDAFASKTWTVNALAVSVTAKLDEEKIYQTGDTIRVTYTPVGTGVEKTTHFLVDGTEKATVTTSASGRQAVQSLTIGTHGAHEVDVYVTVNTDGVSIQSDTVHFCIAVVDPDSTTPIITVKTKTAMGRIHSAASLKYLVYDPQTENARITQEVDGETVSMTVDRTMQVWAYKPRTAGQHTLKITCRTVSETITYTAMELSYDIEPVTEGLIYDFDPAGRSNDAADRDNWVSNGISMTTSSGFDWVNGGYKQDSDGNTAFVIPAGCRATIEYNLFGTSPKANGANAKFVYTVKNTHNFTAGVISCVADGIGLNVTANHATLSSQQTSIDVPLCEGEYTELEYNITAQDAHNEMFLLIGAVPSRFTTYTSTDRLNQSKAVPVVIGSDDCDVWLYRAKAYSVSLTDSGIMDNWIADAPNADEMVARYEGNDILDVDGNIDPDKLANVKPQLRVIKMHVPRFTTDKSDKVTGCTVQMIMKGGRSEDNWTNENVTHKGQGTSSNAYGASARNIDIDCKGQFTFADGTSSGTYSMTDNSIGESYFNIKLNVASSENMNNAMLQRLFNKYNPYIRDSRKNDPRVVDTMEFHPCAVFVCNDSDEEGFEQGKYIFYGVGDFGNSKKNVAAQGLDAAVHPNEVIVELCNNTSPCNRYKSAEGIEGDDFWESDANPNAPLSWRYIASTCDETTARKAWADLVAWVASCDPTQTTKAKLGATVNYGGVTYNTDSESYRRAKFKAEFDKHFVSDSAMFQYCFTSFFLMPDNRAKNTFPHCSDVTAESPLWDFSFDYDNDTAMGINNEGDLTLDFGYEDVDTIDGGNVFNAQDSALWCNVRDCFQDRLQKMFSNLAELWDYNRLIKTFEEYTDTRPQRLLMADMRRKYIRPYEELKTAEGSPITMFIPMLNGDKKLQRRYFLKYQCPYMASKWNGPVAKNDKITLRGFAAPDGSRASVTITPYSDIYVSALFGSIMLQQRCKRGESATLTMPEDTALNDTEIYIYSASLLEKVTGIETIYTNQVDFSAATKLKQIIIGSDADGYQNLNLKSDIMLDFSALKNLEELRIDGCPNLRAPIDVSGCTSLRKFTAKSTPISAVVFAPGGRIEQVVLESPTNLTLREMQNIKVFTVNDAYAALTGLRHESTPFPVALDIVKSAENLNTLRLTGIDWSLSNTSLLNRLLTLEGYNAAGAEIEQSSLSGTVHVKELRSQELKAYNKAWLDLTVTYDTLIQQYAVKFVNYDGSDILNRETKEPLVVYVEKGESVVDPVEVGLCDTPTKPATTTEIYKFSGWDGSMTNVTSDRTLTAKFTAITQHAVSFKNWDGSAILDKSGEPLVVYVERGKTCQDPIKNGLCDTPTRPSTQAQVFTFKGWDGVLTNVTADRTLTATYTSVPQQYTVTWTSDGQTVATAKVDYNTEAVYPLETDPVKENDTENHIYYLFAGWDQPTTRIVADTTVTAVWNTCTLPASGTKLEAMSIEQLYAVKKAGLMSQYVTITDEDTKARIPVTMGWEPSFSGIEFKVLAEDLELDGKTSVDTGVTLLDKDQDWTMVVDGVFDSNTSGDCMVSCYTADGYHGFQVIYSSGFAVRWGSNTANNSKSTSVSTFSNMDTSYVSSQYRELVVLRHIKGSRNLIVYFSTPGNDAPTKKELTKTIDTVSTATIMLGCNNAGTNFATGHLYRCKLWYGDLGDATCQQMANWPYEKTYLEVIGAGGATTTGGTPTNIDLIHAGLLCCDRALFSNSTDSAKKGWPEANIRAWLQKRYMSALPAALREMLEEVKVKSVIYGDGTSAGAKTIESSDKVYLPSKQDMFGGTSAPYTECGKQIPWIISNPTRVRFRGMTVRENYTYTSGSLPDDPAVGDICSYSGYYYIWNGHIWVRAQSFWLRDAYPTYTSYYWYVNYSGYSDYSNSNYSYGIMPRLHL